MLLPDVAVAWIFAMTMYSYIGKINWDESVVVFLSFFLYINGSFDVYVLGDLAW